VSVTQYKLEGNGAGHEGLVIVKTAQNTMTLQPFTDPLTQGSRTQVRPYMITSRKIPSEQCCTQHLITTTGVVNEAIAQTSVLASGQGRCTASQHPDLHEKYIGN
jgi:hypothetical protein